MSQYFIHAGYEVVEPLVVKIRCPACRHAGAFNGYKNVYDIQWSNDNAYYEYAGMRKCPNPDCGALVFVAWNASNGKDVTVFPSELIDFDATSLPPKLLSSLEEAIGCHAAGCYKASALMVRRVLEELCEDKQAVGKNLKDRISSLKSVAVIPSELINAADELRILGNDAAHVEAKDYDQIGKNESELAIELAKELLKAVYQYANLVSRLKALKKP